MTNGGTVSINLAIGPIVSLIAGVLILIVPRLLNYIVAIYLILIGLIGIFGWGGTHLRTAGIEAAPAHVATVSSSADVPSRPVGLLNVGGGSG
jgi:Protein of unknown function (DUF3096)